MEEIIKKLDKKFKILNYEYIDESMAKRLKLKNTLLKYLNKY